MPRLGDRFSLLCCTLLVTSCLVGSAPSVLPDPAPQATAAGEYGCVGCPDTSTDEFRVQASGITSRVFEGTVLNAVGNGRWFVRGPLGQTIGGEIRTNPETGEFRVDTPLYCGTQLVKCLWSNEVGDYVLVLEVAVTDCIEPDIRLTTAWDDKGSDWELHLVRPGGRINDATSDCTWTTCVASQPDWGVPGDATDNPYKDVDNTSSYGPENIALAKPAPGTYHVYVEHWGVGEPSNGRLVVQLGGSTWVQEITGLQRQGVWKAATIQWPEGIVSLSTDVFDCSGQWERGCKAQLP